MACLFTSFQNPVHERKRKWATWLYPSRASSRTHRAKAAGCAGQLQSTAQKNPGLGNTRPPGCFKALGTQVSLKNYVLLIGLRRSHGFGPTWSCGLLLAPRPPFYVQKGPQKSEGPVSFKLVNQGPGCQMPDPASRYHIFFGLFFFFFSKPSSPFVCFQILRVTSWSAACLLPWECKKANK